MNPSSAFRLVPTSGRREPAVREAGRTPVAVVLSNGGGHTAEFLPVLAGLGVTVIDRPFDGEAARIVAAIQPALAVAVCDPTRDEGATMVSTIAAQPIGRLLVVDTGRSPTGTIVALELGADASLAVSENAHVVRATVAALLRRLNVRDFPAAPPSAGPRIRVGNLLIDRDTCEVREGDELVPLTRTEFHILAYLASEAGKVRSPGQIMSAVHDYTYTDAEAQQAVKVYIRRIRRKLAGCSRQSVAIVNSRSFGYRIEALDSVEDDPALPAA